MPGTVYICDDPNLVEVLKSATAAFEKGGWTIIHGPKATPGVPYRLSPAERARFLGEADIIVTSSRSRISGEDLDAAPRLRGIVFPSIGVDAVDLGECAARSLIVGHGPIPENFEAMSESTIMFMLVLLYGLKRTEWLLRENQPRPAWMHARMLKNRTIGIIGMGRIGGGVVRRLNGWGATILVNDPYVARDSAGPDVEFVDKEELLRRSDVVSLHVPLSPETRNLIGLDDLRQMKDDAILINTSRGGVVDEDALAMVMQEGRLGGAALDVLDPEPPAKDHPLRSIDRVILTPHMVGHTNDLYDAMPRAVIENAERIMRGELPLYPKNPEVGPAWRERLSRLGAAA